MFVTCLQYVILNMFYKTPYKRNDFAVCDKGLVITTYSYNSGWQMLCFHQCVIFVLEALATLITSSPTTDVLLRVTCLHSNLRASVPAYWNHVYSSLICVVKAGITDSVVLSIQHISPILALIFCDNCFMKNVYHNYKTWSSMMLQNFTLIKCFKQSLYAVDHFLLLEKICSRLRFLFCGISEHENVLISHPQPCITWVIKAPAVS